MQVGLVNHHLWLSQCFFKTTSAPGIHWNTWLLISIGKYFCHSETSLSFKLICCNCLNICTTEKLLNWFLNHCGQLNCFSILTFINLQKPTCKFFLNIKSLYIFSKLHNMKFRPKFVSLCSLNLTVIQKIFRDSVLMFIQERAIFNYPDSQIVANKIHKNFSIYILAGLVYFSIFYTLSQSKPISLDCCQFKQTNFCHRQKRN